MKNKRGDTEKIKKKCTAISHAIVSAARPKSFLSGLQVGLASFINQKYGSKHLINVLSALGFCSSYDEAALFQISALQHPLITATEKAFCQFVFDNADVNVCTLDGFNSFHAMGGIQTVTPSTTVCEVGRIQRLKKNLPAGDIGHFGHVPIKVFQKSSQTGLLNIKIENINEVFNSSEKALLSDGDFLWVYGKWQNKPHIPGWNGYMERRTAKRPYLSSRIIYLPFINAPPSDYDTIYTALLSAIEKCKSLKQESCVITFDQPLYIKARDIVQSIGPNPESIKIFIRLGGFHFLISFMGAIGYIMNGSGLNKLFQVAYAPASAEKMLTGRAYARALVSSCCFVSNGVC